MALALKIVVGIDWTLINVVILLIRIAIQLSTAVFFVRAIGLCSATGERIGVAELHDYPLDEE